MDIQEILTSNIVDLTSLKEYFSSDKDSLIQLIGVYLTDTTPRVDTLEESLTTMDYESVRSICHFLKSSFGLMGVKCLAEITELEKQAQANDPEDVIKEKLNFVIPICRASIIEYKLILDRLEAL
ncbi:HPt (histidine-containing phosphotransfer) domain-containing protein [Polaribacter sp. KT25b]|uniref:Hpt domain-containing protein n=1 Tax=Polaribacter sp. KT25b TaxID=1855336 RepID=UPI0008793E65|nr:Hpt domain-containing protein [Polaribacter sp. KT25b]SDS13299.1 HPt (histidine-containing phosphotransfer) domain-containing protein [Polaribacter sp. KT25b]